MIKSHSFTPSEVCALGISEDDRRQSLTLDEDYFERRELRLVCTQKFPWEDFLPQASEIFPGLYLCDVYTATSPVVLKRLGITHVISVMRAPWYHYPPSVRHLCVPVDDTKTTNISTYFERTSSWIQAALHSSPDAKVMVHCVWGMSRSASFVVAYLMGTRGMTMEGALTFVKAKRSVVNPNRGFLWQLNVYEQKVRQRNKHREEEQSR
ncbi:phosphatases II [Leucogyrophana mollusca]|uniref:Phosphatases II n=1 Tax=Leucogyrophana mollusca TaxID=85980 RepID=A0ACB8BWF6_9AGAM|nr:phosphatases II [Leucogyrophana mollusca]